MELTDDEFALLRSYIYDACGLVIPDQKRYLVRNRLEPLVREEKLNSFYEFYQLLIRTESTKRKQEIIDAITTHETSFFRDDHPYKAFSNHILPKLAELIQQRKERKKINSRARIWSVAASTGEEAFSIAMLIHAFTQRNRKVGIHDFEILGTDISDRVLEQASIGKFNPSVIQRSVPGAFQKEYFEERADGWYIKNTIRNMVRFQHLNLKNAFLSLGMFDLILCRNVLIYFDHDLVASIFKQFDQMMSKDSCLMLGSSENIYGVTKKFQSVHYGQTTVYKKIS